MQVKEGRNRAQPLATYNSTNMSFEVSGKWEF